MNDNDKEAQKDELKQQEKLNEIQKQEQEMKNRSSGTFGLDILQIEDLMSSYKERGVNFKDLQQIRDLGGPSGIMKKLKTNSKKGISSEENRENDFGSNRLFIEPVPPFCSYVKEALDDLMVKILIISAVVQIILGATLGEDPSKDWIDGLSIILAVLVVTIVGSITNYNKETKFHELNTIQNEGTTYKVIRNGNAINMKSDDILVGDLIHIIVGDILPADLILIEGNGIKMDESSLTGESENVKKEIYENCENYLLNDNKNNKSKLPSPLMLSGTNCIEGSGLAIVLAVGEHSQKGIIKRTVDNAQENNQTPLEKKLDSIAENIGWFGMGAGAITLVALTIRFIVTFFKQIKEYQKESSQKDLVYSFLINYPQNKDNSEILHYANNELTNPKSKISSEIINIIMLCVSIIVVAIPEGLPLAVTLSLAFSIKKLMDENNLVRKMHACETMGGANYICTDKTGTLTKNEMNVYKILTATKEITLTEVINNNNRNTLNIKRKKTFETKIREDHQIYFTNELYWDQLKLALSLNVDGQIKEFEEDENKDTEYCETKNKTDKAFIDFLYRFRVSIKTERNKYIFDNRYYKQIPFDSKKKRMSTVVKNENFPTGYRLFSKGGAEKVNKICTHYLDPEQGCIKPIGDQERNYITDAIEKFNKQMLRSLYICYKDISKEDFENSNIEDLDQNGCVFIACVGIRDSLRNGVKEAVEKCHKAGVNVIMVTGDNIVTATAIAKESGILGEEVNLDNLKPEDIEEEPELTECPNRRDEHIKDIIQNKPQAITGNTFFVAIGGLLCSSCGCESSLCKCPKTQAEADQIYKKKNNNNNEILIKNDTIKNKQIFYELTRNLKVMARSQPIHKYALVLGLKELDQIVAVTGDGTNDAPALSKSDVGFAMFAGTDIAKESSDIVIMNNNFSSLVIAIIYGRNIYDNIRKFLQFQLTVNFCACLLVFICACIGNETPLMTIQMLWINLIMDSLGSLSLATEPPYEELLNREPTRKSEFIINGKMCKHIVFQSLVQLGILIFLYLYAPYFIKENDYVKKAENIIINFCYGELPGKAPIDNVIFGISPKWSNDIKLKKGEEYLCGRYYKMQDLNLAYTEYINVNSNSPHMTIIFNVFVLYTLFNQINCRVIDDTFNIFIRINKNFFCPAIIVGELILQIIIIEFGGNALKCTERGLTFSQWLICIGFSFISIILSFIIKLTPIDGIIQRFFDNSSKSNKVANMEDLILEENEMNNSRQLLNANNNNNIYKREDQKKGSLKGSSLIKKVKRNSSFSVENNLRQGKANVPLPEHK